MWILPKQLHTSPFAPDTEALISDSDEFCQMCEQSLMWRSKPSQLRTWLQGWKRENWMQHLSGRTLKRCHWKSFEAAYQSYLAASPANPSQPQESGKVTKTPDTCSRT